MHVGVRIYATQARGVMYSPPPGIFPSTRPGVRRSVLHHSGARWFCAICNSDVGRGTRSVNRQETHSYSRQPPHHLARSASWNSSAGVRYLSTIRDRVPPTHRQPAVRGNRLVPGRQQRQQ